jgi:hypothetical protein
MDFYAIVAHLAEQRPFKAWVAGSIPAGRTILRAVSSVGQSWGLIIPRSGVQIPHGPPFCKEFA